MKKMYVLTGSLVPRFDGIPSTPQVICVVTATSVEEAAQMLRGTVKKTNWYANSGDFTPGGNGFDKVVAELHKAELDEVVAMMSHLKEMRLHQVPHLS